MAMMMMQQWRKCDARDADCSAREAELALCQEEMAICHKELITQLQPLKDKIPDLVKFIVSSNR
jgi:hypothetical protein